MKRGDAAAVGRLCVAAVQLGPEEAEAVRRIAVSLLESGAAGVDAAVTVASAFWEQAGLAGAPEPAQHQAELVKEEKGAASTLQAAAESELAAGTAALSLEPAGPAASATGKHLSEHAVAAEAHQSSSTAEPEAAPTAAELRQAAAIVLAAAVVEVAQHGLTGPLVDVTERLLAAGQAELVALLVAAMVEAGELRRAALLLPAWRPRAPSTPCLPALAAGNLPQCIALPLPPSTHTGYSAEAGAISVAALASGKHRVVEALAGEAATSAGLPSCSPRVCCSAVLPNPLPLLSPLPPHCQPSC